MDDAKHAPLIWDFFKLIIAVVITALPALSITCDLRLYEGLIRSLAPHIVDAFDMCVFMTQLPAVLAGWWGYQTVRNLHKATEKNEWMRDYVTIHYLIWLSLLILSLYWIVCAVSFLLPFIDNFTAWIVFFSMFCSLFLAPLLFLALIVLTTMMAFKIRERFFLHLLTIYCLFAAHLLLWRLFITIGIVVIVFF